MPETADQKLFCYLQTFKTFQQWKNFMTTFQYKPQNERLNRITMQPEKQNFIRRREKENVMLQYKIIPEKKIDDYIFGQLIISKPQLQENQNSLSYFVEKEYINGKNDVQVQSSLLFEISPSEDFKSKEKWIRSQKSDDLRPDAIYVYITSQNKQHLDTFVQKDGVEVASQFMAQFAQFLHMGPGKTSFNHIGAKVRGLTKQILREIDLSQFCWTIKIDGLRSLVVLNEKNSKQYILQQAHQDIFDLTDSVHEYKYTVLDCEYYADKYYAFDILMYKGEDIMGKTYQQRLDVLKKMKLPKNIILKKFYEITSTKDLKRFQEEHANGIETDGIVISNMQKTYLQTQSYKLKQKKYLTNDYLIKIVPLPNLAQRQLTGFKDGDFLYELYVGASDEMFKCVNNQTPISHKYQKMLFSVPFFKTLPSQYMLVNKKTLDLVKVLYPGKTEIHTFVQMLLTQCLSDIIVECAFDENMRPYPIRLRDDKTYQYRHEHNLFGNHFTTALSNLQNAMDPITVEYLDDPTNNQYFNVKIKDRNKDGSYTQFIDFGRKCRHYAYDQLLSHVHGKKSALDIGAGRNVDYASYIKYRFENLICYEPDVQANIEYFKRIRDILQHETKSKPTTYIVNQYCSSPVRDQLSFIKINFFTSNYAFHYLCDSDATLLDLKTFILCFAKEGAFFQILDYDGADLLKLITEKGDSGVFDNGRYHVDLVDRSQKTLLGTGQKINIMLPTISTTMTQEYLVNIQHVAQLFAPQIELIENIKMCDVVTVQMDADDKDYLSCQHQYIFKINV